MHASEFPDRTLHPDCAIPGKDSRYLCTFCKRTVSAYVLPETREYLSAIWQRTEPNFYQGEEFARKGTYFSPTFVRTVQYLCTWDRMVSRRDKERGRPGGPQSEVVVACSAFQSALDPLVKRQTLIRYLSIHDIFSIGEDHP